MKETMKKFILKKLLEIRKKTVCTSATLQRELLRAMGVDLEESTIRRILTDHGYKWKRRSTKPKYSADDKRIRKAWAEEILKMTQAQLKKFFSMSMDGVVLSLPPQDPDARLNYCRNLETHIWRKDDEAQKEELLWAQIYMTSSSHTFVKCPCGVVSGLAALAW